MSAPDTRRTPEAVTAMLVAAVVTAQFVAGRASRDTLFLTDLGTTALPAVGFAAAALSVVLSLGGARVLPGVSTSISVPIAFVVSTGLFVVEWLLLSGPCEQVVDRCRSKDAGAIALYLHVSGLGPLLGSGFWLVASEQFDPRTARGLFARLTAAGTVGGLLGGLLANRVAAAAGAVAVLPILAVLNLVAAWQIRRLASSAAVETDVSGPHEQATASTWAGVAAIAKVAYLRRLAAVVALGSVGATLVDYTVKAQAFLDRPGDALMHFFSVYYAVVHLLVFVVQVLSSRLSTERLGLVGAVASPSLGLLAGCGAGLVTQGLASVAIARGTESVLRASMFRSAYEVFFTPLPAHQKRAAKSIVDVAFDRLGEAAGSAIVALVLFGASTYARPMLLVLAMGCSLAAAAAARGLARLYVGALEHRLRGRALELRLSSIHDRMTRTLMQQSLTAAGVSETTMRRELATLTRRNRDRSPIDADFLQILALRSGNRSRLLRVLDPGNTLAARVVSHVIPLLESNEVARAAMRSLERVADARAGELTDALLDRNVPAVVRRRLARVLGKGTSQRVMDGLVLALDDGRSDVRQQSARSLLALRRRAPELRLDSERIFASARREVQRLERTDGDDAGVAHIFTLLSVVLPGAPLKAVQRGLKNSDPVLRGTALEYLAGVLPADLRDALLSLLEGASAPARASPARRMLTVAPELDLLPGLLAVIAAVLSKRPMRFDHAQAHGMCTFRGDSHGIPLFGLVTLRPGARRHKLGQGSELCAREMTLPLRAVWCNAYWARSVLSHLQRNSDHSVLSGRCRRSTLRPSPGRTSGF